MQLLVATVGKPKLGYARQGAEVYGERLRLYVRFELEHVKSGSPEEEAARLLAVSEGAVRVALDPGGWEGSTEAWHQQWEEWERRGEKRIAFLVGGASGHGRAVEERCLLWSLSKLTLQHELALVVLLEQLYRVQTIRRGEPYHRG